MVIRKLIRSRFDYKKGTQALNFLAKLEGGCINKMKVLKLIYFADRYHLRKYGRLVTNDTYLAMKYGPVPSAIKDIAEANDYLDKDMQDYSVKFVVPVDNLRLKSVNKPDVHVFSESDLEALKFAWDNFGHLTQFELRDLTHKYPEWKKYEALLDNSPCIEMKLEDFLKDPVEEVNRCFELNTQDKTIRREQLAEISHIESLWS